MSYSNNSINSGRRYEEELQFNKPICDCGFESVIRTSWTVDNPGRRFYDCPNYKRNVNNCCQFLRWIDPIHGARNMNNLGGLFRKLEEIEANVKQLQILVEERNDEVDRMLKLLKNVKFGCLIYVIGNG
ncbi:uncharacterized protein LOC133833955 [Humulus lupulus]|uniref:uncharacterized protein LOC133833955 n=1 Tax=Humulus lupulus TaxID=3486 RepID=UPI002B4021B1|nr:uncharacterized protein LOC133833955 [Humulus lupulus]